MDLEFAKTRVIGVDISLKTTSIGIVDIRGNIVAETQMATLEYESLPAFVNKLCETIIKLAEDNGGVEKIRSVGVSAPSGNLMHGSIVNAANFPWQGEIPLAAMMRDLLGMAVGVANDCHASGMGEKIYGAAHGLKDFIAIHLGTGLGSCFFSDGKIQLGADGYAGEMGHMCMVENGRQCGCGYRGCLEAYVNTNGIIMTARELMSQSDKPSLMRSLDHLSPRTIKECCDKGDEMAIEVYRITGEYLGWGLSIYASVLNPEAIVFAGGISNAGKWLLGPTRDTYERLVFHNVRGRTKMYMSMLDDYHRDMLGASAVAWDVQEYSLFK
mgnify:CR=1 FL=1